MLAGDLDRLGLLGPVLLAICHLADAPEGAEGDEMVEPRRAVRKRAALSFEPMRPCAYSVRMYLSVSVARVSVVAFVDEISQSIGTRAPGRGKGPDGSVPAPSGPSGTGSFLGAVPPKSPPGCPSLSTASRTPLVSRRQKRPHATQSPEGSKRRWMRTATT
jgi:hypothetical protein